MDTREILEKIAALEYQEIEIKLEKIALIKILANSETKLFEIENLEIPKFRRLIDAYKWVLKKHPDGLHVGDISNELSLIGIEAKPVNIGGVLRSYDRQKKLFEALGGNKFKLREEDK